jgi:predicted N-acetyltransferase YhbS
MQNQYPTNTQTIEIKSLADCKEHIPQLAELWYEEISRHWAPNASIEKAKQKLTEHLNDNKMPMALVALQNNKPIGMACLRENDGIRPGIAPWLGSLVVHHQHRSQAVGKMLIDAIKLQARALSYPMLYLLAFDPTIPTWYARLGWQFIGTDELFGHPVTVMSISL